MRGFIDHNLLLTVYIDGLGASPIWRGGHSETAVIGNSRGAIGSEWEIGEVLFGLSARAEDDEAGDEAEAEAQ